MKIPETCLIENSWIFTGRNKLRDKEIAPENRKKFVNSTCFTERVPWTPVRDKNKKE